MGIITKDETGGASIKPSARPSIHSHWHCPFASNSSHNTMGRYGVVDNREVQESANKQGADEVDNVLSKPAQPIRPPSRLKRYSHKINSLQKDSIQYSEDEDSLVLSTSAPGKLETPLYYSDDSGDEAPFTKGQFSDESLYSFSTPNTSDVSRAVSTPIINMNPESARVFHHKRDETQNNNSSSKYILLFFALLVGACAFMWTNNSNISQLSVYDECRFYTDISGLGERYNVDENAILQVRTGISTIFKRHDTGSFMFVYNSAADNFNSQNFNKFINDVSYAASKYLRNGSHSVHYTTVEGTNLDMEEYSELICRYREELDRTGVMLVRHVEAIPSELAMAFHYYCDEYNPLVKKSAIFFTLNMAECPWESDKKSSHALIEKCLTKKWNTIPDKNISPLLTRVVSVVIDVTSAF